MTTPRKQYGMTRPRFLIALVILFIGSMVVMIAFGSFSTWLAWSLGGLFVGAAFLTFDFVRNGNHV